MRVVEPVRPIAIIEPETDSATVCIDHERFVHVLAEFYNFSQFNNHTS